MRTSLLALLLSTTAALAQPREVKRPGGDVEVLFSPRGGCLDRILEQIDSAKTSVHMQCYSFTTLKIVDALKAARDRGCEVKVIFDKSWPATSPRTKQLLQAAGVPVLVDARHAIAHQKSIIIDGARVLEGSYNFSAQAELYNSEDSVLIYNKTVAQEYERNFAIHRAHSN